MSPQNREFRLLNKFLKKLNLRVNAMIPLRGNKAAAQKGVEAKNKIVEFYKKNGRWPSRLSSNKRERKLGLSYENFCSKESLSYDKDFRRVALVLGRKTNSKRKHDKAAFKKEILEFVKTYGFIPRRYGYATIPGEGNLRGKINYYVGINGDMTFLGQLYEADPCHRSGIPTKFRRIINESLNVEKPLIRMIKD